ncbi:hypothetical protein CORMATOL_03158 [Corynebacterium matruchotii ATCC 33806]|uniref:Uncharacterized protein n=1 Tax=Corynebacterium matruchotii ATCC 33806 TaxID=566549 RepID=C0E816_9CORY|nr:hypothetical protein CORMATOL_03158 [Corynebacterium matruchotii ATCC 33806]
MSITVALLKYFNIYQRASLVILAALRRFYLRHSLAIALNT